MRKISINANIYVRCLPLVFISVLIFSAACGNRNQQQHPVKDKDSFSRAEQDTLSSAAGTGKGDSIIHVTFPSGESSVVIFGKLGSPGAHVSLIVPVQHIGHLVGVLVPSDPSANIRFGQVIYPNGRSDGPFGREVSIPAKSKGIYRLIVSHNLMAEGAVVGDFKVRISMDSLQAPQRKSGR